MFTKQPNTKVQNDLIILYIIVFICNQKKQLNYFFTDSKLRSSKINSNKKEKESTCYLYTFFSTKKNFSLKQKKVKEALLKECF